jgi:formate dehydrogenase subunit delta
MNVERLIEMANDIANFFAADPDREAGIEGVANHLRKFWEPRMRRQLLEHVRAHGPGALSEVARAGVARLAQTSAA